MKDIIKKLVAKGKTDEEIKKIMAGDEEDVIELYELTSLDLDETVELMKEDGIDLTKADKFFMNDIDTAVIIKDDKAIVAKFGGGGFWNNDAVIKFLGE